MTPKERAAMQQALEALHYAVMASGGETGCNHEFNICFCKENNAITALREALAEPDLNLNCKSVQKRLATSWGYVKAEQAEQEPVAIADGTFNHNCQLGTPLYAAPVSAEAIRADQRQKDAAACYLRANSWKDNAARAAKLCGDAITAMGNDTV